ncbi:unnamed protein product [Haemonchus placei]|uniref:Rad21_Rec8 domain-containing protein n=1 Tax=Haemonchus placei TaxID=6290 RepID=A0A0N4WGD0_HAEPC|nr:unnamed protein product [Haemonchus placei]
MSTEYTLNEVARHCTADDLWIAYKGGVRLLFRFFGLHSSRLRSVSLTEKSFEKVLVVIFAFKLHKTSF